MVKVKIFSEVKKYTPEEQGSIVRFLLDNLDGYEDEADNIVKALDFAASEGISFGGFTIVASLEDKIIGVLVLNRTGMKSYMPENKLVYIAVHREHRRLGLGKYLLIRAQNITDGVMSVNIKKSDSTRVFFKKVGFSSEVIELRT